MAGSMFKLDQSGHGLVAKWNDSPADIHRAEQEFKTLAARGYTMFRGEARDDGEVLRSFDPEAEVIIATPRMQGG